MVQKFIATAISMPPSYVVSPEGQFLRIEGLEAFRNRILEGMDDALAELPPSTREQVIQGMGAIFTRGQLEAGLASDWDSHVGTWIGAELNQGDLYELTFDQPIPAFGNMEVPIRTTFRFKQRVSCNAAEPPSAASISKCIRSSIRRGLPPRSRPSWRGCPPGRRPRGSRISSRRQ
jgi:hypothetical protein